MRGEKKDGFPSHVVLADERNTDNNILFSSDTLHVASYSPRTTICTIFPQRPEYNMQTLNAFSSRGGDSRATSPLLY